jgi:hypothetical protein
MTKADFDPNVAFPLYCDAISEIRFRMEMARSLIASNPPKLGPSYLHEFCYLQLRKICELIAIGCLIAHGDIRGADTSKLQKAWNADKIILALTKLHSNFYPEPFKIVATRIVGAHALVGKVSAPFMTKADLLSLYNVECPKYLHWGKVDDFIARRRPPIDQNRLLLHFSKIENLISRHRIHLHGTSQALQIDATLPNCGTKASLWASMPTFPMA